MDKNHICTTNTVAELHSSSPRVLTPHQHIQRYNHDWLDVTRKLLRVQLWTKPGMENDMSNQILLSSRDTLELLLGYFWRIKIDGVIVGSVHNRIKTISYSIKIGLVSIITSVWTYIKWGGGAVKWQTNITTLLVQFQNLIEKS